MGQRPFPPLIALDLVGPVEISFKGVDRSPARFIVKDQDIALGVEMKRAEVEIGRSNHGHVVICHQSLRMQNGWLVLEDTHAARQ